MINVNSISCLKNNYILIFFSITFISAAMESGYYFLLPYLEGQGIAIGTLGGLAMGICYGVSLTARPFVPILERYCFYNKILLLGYAFFFLSAMGIALFTDTLYSAIIWRGFAGLGLSLVGVSLTAYERHFIPEEIRGQSIAFITIAYSLPSLVIVPPMEWLVTNKMYTCYIFSFPVMLLVGTAIISKLPKLKAPPIYAPSKTEAESNLKIYIKLLKNRSVLLFITVSALFALTDAGQLVFVQLASEKGVAASYFFSISAGTALFLRFLCGKVLDMIPRRVYAVGAGAITAAMMLSATFASTPLAFMLCGLVFGVGMGFGYPMLMCLVLDLGGEKYTTRLAVVFGLIYSGSFFVAPVLIEFTATLVGTATAAYRIIYGMIFIASLTLTLRSIKKYKKATQYTETEW